MFGFTVIPDSGESFEVTAESRDVLVWERTGQDRVMTNLLGGAFRMQDAYSLAFVAAKRQGLYSGTQSEFESSVNIKLGHRSEEPDPT